MFYREQLFSIPYTFCRFSHSYPPFPLFRFYFSAQIYDFGRFPNKFQEVNDRVTHFVAAASGATHALNFVVDFEAILRSWKSSRRVFMRNECGV